jgi:serine/threonine protein kinase
MSTAIPQRLGDFEIVRELGRGGMGVVYEARQVSLNRKVALKVLGGGLGLTGKAVQRFRREAEAAAKLHHTNIVPVYATGEQDGTHFYAMELIEGPSLDHVLRQLRQENRSVLVPGEPGRVSAGRPRGAHATPISNPDATGPYVGHADSTAESSPPLGSSSLGSGSAYFDAVARMIAEVADALAYAHQNGVIHRDVKPSNLLLSPQGRLSVNDFGLARVLEQPGMTLTGEFVGTPAYTSPEQITAGRIPLDHRTDVYSLGATLYELLTLQPPFTGKQRDQVLAQIVQKEPRSPRKVNKKVPVDLETICLKALEKDPDRRYQTAGQMAEDLRRYVNRFAISARRAGPMQRLVKWVRRRPALAAALTFALLAVLTASFFAYSAHRHQQQLLEEKRQNVLDKALVAAIGGDFEAADRAVDDAELLGASPGQIRILRGQVALDRGDLKTALRHLQQAIELLPDSVAARAAQARAYFDAGDWSLWLQTLHELEQLPPVTPEDYLFKGRIESQDDPARALISLEEAVRRLPGSGMARLARAEAQSWYALTTASPDDAELAIRYANTAKDMLPGNPTALVESVYAHLVAATTYDKHGPPDKRREALKQAGRDVKALEGYTTPIRVLWMRVEYFDYIGDDEAVLRECRRAKEKSNDPIVAWKFVSRFFQLDQLEEARDLVDQRLPQVGSKMDYLVLKGFVVAELDDGQAQAQAAADLARREVAVTPATAAATPGPHSLLRYLGRKTEAEEICREIRARLKGPFPSRPEWNKKLLDYNCGDLTDQQLLRAAGSSCLDQCEGHFHIALTKLADGDRAGTREHFRKVIDTGTFSAFEFRWSRAFLSRMEVDPNWPPWIPVKK